MVGEESNVVTIGSGTFTDRLQSRYRKSTPDYRPQDVDRKRRELGSVGKRTEEFLRSSRGRFRFRCFG